MTEPLKKFSLSQRNRPLDNLYHFYEKGDIDLNPPYQREVVWNDDRQRALICSIIRGFPIPSIVLNDRLSAGWLNGRSEGATFAVVDGKQRLTSIIRFMSGELDVPSHWHELFDNSEEFYRLPQESVSIPRRHFSHKAIATVEGTLSSIEEEEELYNLVNYGGVPHGESDFD